MLFCDACDKGYHMQCHVPDVKIKPQGIKHIHPYIDLDPTKLVFWVSDKGMGGSRGGGDRGS